MLQRGWTWAIRRATTVACPKCGNAGRGHGSNCRFEARGKHEGYTVYKCLGCKSGLLVSPLSGMFFGRPKIISELKWFDLEALWTRAFRQLNMKDEDIAEVGLMLLSMSGFVHGYRRLDAESNLYGDVSPAQQFYLNSLRALIVNYFIGTSKSPSDVNARDILEKHGLHQLLVPIDRLLDTPLGATTYKGIVTKFRNKYLTHELFQVKPLQKLHDDFDLQKNVNWVTYHGVFYDLRERYPTAWMIVGDANP